MTDEFDDGQWGTSNIDVVAAPVRYPRSPLIALLALTVLPAIALLVLFRWADREADAYEASRGATGLFEEQLVGTVGDPEAPTTEPLELDDDLVLIDEVAPVLTTSMFDYRRAPRVVASVASLEQLETAVDPVFGFIGPTSCAAVAVDGVTVTADPGEVVPQIAASHSRWKTMWSLNIPASSRVVPTCSVSCAGAVV